MWSRSSRGGPEFWARLLAPYLKDRGRYTASGDAARDIAPLKVKIAISPELYGKTIMTGNSLAVIRNRAAWQCRFCSDVSQYP